MSEDTFGRIYRLTDGGDTHGGSLWGRIDGCPAGIPADYGFIAGEMARRAPSDDSMSTRRREADKVMFLSGIDGGLTTGRAIRFEIPNCDVRHDMPGRHVIRPSHASYSYFRKYGFTDNEQCGRASARQTACRVVAGAVAKLALRPYGITFRSETLYTGKPGRDGDSVGAAVQGHILNVPAGLGEPVYDKFSARLAYAMLSINAAKGFDIGWGYRAAHACGSEYNDRQDCRFRYLTNHDGGVQAGITNGEEICFTVAFKPIPSVRFPQTTVDFEGRPAVYTGSERNDRCAAPRVLPVVEAMAAMVTLDFLLISQNATT